MLNKKILVYGILFLMMASLVSAEVCEVDRVKQVLKKILFLYYTEPNSVPLTKDEVKDMLVFYLSISDQNLTVDCSAFGSRSNKPISDVVNAGENVADKIPACADGTKYGECSKFRPAYCYSGAIYQKCGLCGCPTNSVCGKSDKCESQNQNITCNKDIDCGQNTFAGEYSCINNYISRVHVEYFCLNAGTPNSKCASANGTVSLTYCNPNLNQTCVAGQSYCKVPVTNVSAPVVNNSTLTIKGRIIDYFTKQPIANGLIFTWDSQTLRRDTYTNSNGEFSTTADTTQITATTAKPFGIEPNCYNNMGMGVFRNSDNSLSVNVNINSLIGAGKYLSVTGSEVNVGDIPMWPAVDIQIDSDTYVKFNLEYGSSTGAGNSLYKIFHYLSYSFPLTVDTRVKLTDQANNNYYSPYLNLPLSNGCQKVGLAFYNKQFSWNGSAAQTNSTANATNQTSTTGICLIRDSYTNVPVFSAPDLGTGYAKLAKPGINTISGLQSACTQSDYNNLLASYCTQNSNPVQQSVMTYDSYGNYQSLSCGAFGCNYVNCPAGTNQTNQTAPANQTTTTNQTTNTSLSVTLISPNGGEVLQKGNTYTVQWTNQLQGGFSGSQNMGWSVNIYRPGDGVWEIAGGTLPITQSSYQWTVSSSLPAASDYRARITLYKNCIYSTYPCPEPTQILPAGSSDDSDGAISIINQTSNQTTLSPTGVCEVRDSYTSVPLFSAPDVGVGYAKKAIPGVNTIDGLKIACTNDTFLSVMQSYCTQNSNPMTQEVMTYSSTGSWQSVGGSSNCCRYFCKYLSYPPPNSGVCMISDAYTSISPIAFWDSDVGKGYAKMAKNGINTIAGLQSACTQADYTTLLQKYCAQNSNPVQQGVNTYGPGGGLQSSSCGAFGCNYVSC